MNKFTDNNTNYINEEFKPNKLLSYTYPHFSSAFPLILIKKTKDSYLVGWRTKKNTRDCWIPSKAVTHIKEFTHDPELKNTYITFWIKHWYVESTQSKEYSTKDNYMFFDEWNAAVVRLRHSRKKNIEEEEYYTKSTTPYFAQSFPSYLKQYRPE